MQIAAQLDFVHPTVFLVTIRLEPVSTLALLFRSECCIRHPDRSSQPWYLDYGSALLARNEVYLNSQKSESLWNRQQLVHSEQPTKPHGNHRWKDEVYHLQSGFEDPSVLDRLARAQGIETGGQCAASDTWQQMAGQPRQGH